MQNTFLFIISFYLLLQILTQKILDLETEVKALNSKFFLAMLWIFYCACNCTLLYVTCLIILS